MNADVVVDDRTVKTKVRGDPIATPRWYSTGRPVRTAQAGISNQIGSCWLELVDLTLTGGFANGVWRSNLGWQHSNFTVRTCMSSEMLQLEVVGFAFSDLIWHSICQQYQNMAQFEADYLSTRAKSMLHESLITENSAANPGRAPNIVGSTIALHNSASHQTGLLDSAVQSERRFRIEVGSSTILSTPPLRETMGGTKEEAHLLRRNARLEFADIHSAVRQPTHSRRWPRWFRQKHSQRGGTVIFSACRPGHFYSGAFPAALVRTWTGDALRRAQTEPTPWALHCARAATLALRERFAPPRGVRHLSRAPQADTTKSWSRLTKRHATRAQAGGIKRPEETLSACPATKANSRTRPGSRLARRARRTRSARKRTLLAANPAQVAGHRSPRVDVATISRRVPTSTSAIRSVRAGFKCEGKDTGRQPCTPGYYANREGSVACIACSPGTASSDTGRKSICDKCSAGRWQEASGKTSCAACAAGRFVSLKGATSCIDCSTGRSNGEENKSTCTPCARNTFADAPGAQACKSCPIGWTSFSESGRCIKVPPGSYVNASNVMVQCEPGHKCEGGENGRVACLPGSYATQPGSVSALRVTGRSSPPTPPSSATSHEIRSMRNPNKPAVQIATVESTPTRALAKQCALSAARERRCRGREMSCMQCLSERPGEHGAREQLQRLRRGQMRQL